MRPAVRPPLYARRLRDGRHGPGEEFTKPPRRLDDDAVLVQRVHVGEEAARLVVVCSEPARTRRPGRARAPRRGRGPPARRRRRRRRSPSRTWSRPVSQCRTLARRRRGGSARREAVPQNHRAFLRARAGRAPRRRPWHSSAPRRRASRRRGSALDHQQCTAQPFQRFVGRVAARLLQRLGDVSQRCSGLQPAAGLVAPPLASLAASGAHAAQCYCSWSPQGDRLHDEPR